MRGRQRFLRVTSGHLFEVELQAARTLERLELQSLEAAEIESETQTQRELAPEVSLGLGVLGEMLGFSQEPAALGNLGSPWFLICAEEGAGGAQSAPGCLGGRPGNRASGPECGCWPRLFNGVQSCYFPLCSWCNPNPSAWIFWSPLPSQDSELPSGAPVLALRFSYICPDRHLRRYVVLEPDAHAAVQVIGPRKLVGGPKAGGRALPGHGCIRLTPFQELLAVLTPAVTEAQHQLEEVRDPLGGRLQCLRCGHEFKPGDIRLGLDSEESWKPLFQNTGASPALDVLACVLSAILGKMALRGGSVEGIPREGRSRYQLPA